MHVCVVCVCDVCGVWGGVCGAGTYLQGSTAVNTRVDSRIPGVFLDCSVVSLSGKITLRSVWVCWSGGEMRRSGSKSPDCS